MTINTVENKKRAAEILLVEDNRGDTVLARRAFKDASLTTNLSAADSAEQALAILRKEGENAKSPTPDLILLD